METSESIISQSEPSDLNEQTNQKNPNKSEYTKRNTNEYSCHIGQFQGRSLLSCDNLEETIVLDVLKTTWLNVSFWH